MFKGILIANRGEIALRVIRACQELDVRAVAVYSEADSEALHVRLADEAVCIGPAPPAQSYLNIPRIISAASIANCEAIHPGYGFLAENARFAEICESCGITFIGPSSTMIRKMGDKAYARETMREVGVPILPGSPGRMESSAEAASLASELGLPVIIKAADGGGGRGMRVVWKVDDLAGSFAVAQAEAEAAFGSRGVYLEKFLVQPRHVEFQLMGDSYGNVVHLNERDCSIQRRHQKLVEETPSPALDASLREAMGEAAVRGATSISYQGAGTAEFLLDSDRNFYFMEMNARIQVEHPVTEEATRLDLIKEQIRVAAGERLSISQQDIALRGHAIECRVNAEDPARGFRPSPGRITYLHMPGGPGVRIDSHVYTGYEIPSHYDSMIGKIIAFGADRAEAISRMSRALGETIIEGVETTIPFHLQVMENDNFRRGDYDTGFVERLLSGEWGEEKMVEKT
jgi:acetyl-CoA carboxylase biotin carboxylase subunit